MITLKITGHTLRRKKTASEKKEKEDFVHITGLLARHRLNIQGVDSRETIAAEEIMLYQQHQGYKLMHIQMAYNMNQGIQTISTWRKKDSERSETYMLSVSIALALKSGCPVHIEKPLFERIKDKKVIRINHRYGFEDPLLYRLDMVSNCELKDLLQEHTYANDHVNVALIQAEFIRRISEDSNALPGEAGHSVF